MLVLARLFTLISGFLRHADCTSARHADSTRVPKSQAGLKYAIVSRSFYLLLVGLFTTLTPLVCLKVKRALSILLLVGLFTCFFRSRSDTCPPQVRWCFTKSIVIFIPSIDTHFYDHFAGLRKGKLLSAKLLAQELCGELLLGETDLGPYTPWIAGNVMCVHTCLLACTCVCVCMCVYACVYLCMHVYTHTHTTYTQHQ
jgi:hypothetical protein